MSSCDFDKLKYVDAKAMLLLHGFIHESEKNLSLTIPDLITFVCIFYYYQWEYFTVHGPRIELNEMKNIATARDTQHEDGLITAGEQHNTVYGNIAIDASKQLIYEWTIKILSTQSDESNENIYIGIDSSNKSRFDMDFSEYAGDIDHAYYAFGTDSTIYSNGNAGRRWNYKSYDDPKAVLDDGDTVIMELDTMNNKLRYFINDIDLDIEYCNENLIVENEIFYLAIALGCEGASVELIHFEIKDSPRATNKTGNKGL